MKKHIGLLFGSFNPIHIGHLIIAETVADQEGIDQVWLVVSPQNPFKQKKDLLNQYDRLHLVELAINGNLKLKSSNIEFNLPKPSYTITTLTYLKEKYPTYDFSLIMGEDNLEHFHKWKNHEAILKYHNIIIYPRIESSTNKYADFENVKRLDVPYIGISATLIRKSLKAGKTIRYLVNEAVYDYVMKTNWWRG
ncbi:MAG: nicotinate (nicotinamide) nucleotide adenylyltransferase [Chitinophagales bacterium]